jgi:hypothetical protein
MNDARDMRNLFGALDQRLVSVLLDLFRNSVFEDGPNSLTFELFLCEVYARYPEEVGNLFRDTSRFDDLRRKFRPRPISDIAGLPPEEFTRLMRLKAANAGLTDDSTVGGRRVAGMDVPLESSLTDTLRGAAKLAEAAGRPKAGIVDFVDAFSFDATLVARLYKETGLLPKVRTGPDPD